jgi:hypothetical protein
MEKKRKFIPWFILKQSAHLMILTGLALEGCVLSIDRNSEQERGSGAGERLERVQVPPGDRGQRELK